MHVFFDLDRTIFDFESAENAGIQFLFNKYSSQLCMSEQEFKSAFKIVAQKYFDEYSQGILTFDQQRKKRVWKIFEMNGINLDEADVGLRFEEYWNAYEKKYLPFPDAVPVLEKLKKKNIPMGVITNGDSENQRKKLKRACITDYFSVLVISGECGYSKPDRRIFEHALKSCGEKKFSDLVYVGDSLVHDIEPSVMLGLNTAYLDRSQSADFILESEKPVYAKIKSLSSIEKILDVLL